MPPNTYHPIIIDEHGVMDLRPRDWRRCICSRCGTGATHLATTEREWDAHLRECAERHRRWEQQMYESPGARARRRQHAREQGNEDMLCPACDDLGLDPEARVSECAICYAVIDPCPECGEQRVEGVCPTPGVHS